MTRILFILILMVSAGCATTDRIHVRQYPIAISVAEQPKIHEIKCSVILAELADDAGKMSSMGMVSYKRIEFKSREDNKFYILGPALLEARLAAGDTVIVKFTKNNDIYNVKKTAQQVSAHDR